MTKHNNNYPNNMDYRDLVFDFSDEDFPKMNTPQPELGFVDKAINTGGAIFEGMGFIPEGARNTAVDTSQGFDASNTEEAERRKKFAAEQEAYRKKYQGQAFEGVTDAMLSAPYFLMTMGAGLLGGMAGAVAGPVGAAAGSMSASGTVAYRASVAEFNRTLHQASTESLGRTPTSEEWQKIQTQGREGKKFVLNYHREGG